MDRTGPTLNQVNIVSGNVDASIAFYRRLGVDIPDPRIWRTATGAHHVTAIASGEGEAASLDLELGMLLPGIRIKTGPNDYFPIEQMQMTRFNGEYTELFGPVLSGELGGT